MYIPREWSRSRKTSRFRIRLLALAALICGLTAIALLPRAIDAAQLLLMDDDPVAIADRELANRFDQAAATREIEQALAGNDADLAKSFVELARDRGIAIAPELAKKVEEANTAAATAQTSAESFARGLIVGEPDDMVSLAGTALGDLFVYGDIRDAIREGVRWSNGEEVDQIILGLSCVGIAITAGTYASMGIAAPARVGVSIVKAARKTGRLGTRLASYVTRSLRSVVDWSALRKAMASASITEPALAVRAAREAVKVEKADDLLRLTRDVGRVQTKAGTQAAFDALKTAETPREMTRLARLADAKGGQTRAIVKFLGRSAIALTLAFVDLTLWLFWVALMIFGFVSSLKGATERATWRYLQKKKARRLAKRERELALGIAEST